MYKTFNAISAFLEQVKPPHIVKSYKFKLVQKNLTDLNQFNYLIHLEFGVFGLKLG